MNGVTEVMAMPQAVEIEQAVIGAVLIDAGAIVDVGDFLRPEAFFRTENAYIWDAILTLYRQRNPIDLLTVTATLRAKGRLEMVGGPFYISQLSNKVASSANIEYHARIIMQLHIRREQIRIGKSMMDRGYSDTADVFDSLADAASDLRQLSEFGSGGARSMSEVMGEVVDGDVVDRGVPFGYHALDKRIRLEPGTVTIIGARPAMGKTSFMLSSAWRQAQQGMRPYILQLEMKDRNLARRLVCGETGVPIWKVKRGITTEHERSLMAQWHIDNADTEARMLIDEEASLTVSSLAARLDRAKRKQGIDVVWIDYLGLLKPSTRQKTKYDHVTAISNELRVLAKEIDLPFAVLAQLSRPQKTASAAPPPLPKLNDLRDSGEIEQDAEAVCFLHRPKYYDPNAGDELQFIIAKYRDGEDGMEELGFDGAGIRVVDRIAATEVNAFRPSALVSHPDVRTNSNTDDAPF